MNEDTMPGKQPSPYGGKGGRGCLTVLLVLGALVGGLVYIHHIRGAKFRATATLIEALTVDECVATFDQFGYVSYARDACRGHESDLWFSISVKNVGHRGAYVLTCVVEATSAAGHLLYVGQVHTPPVGFPVNLGLHLNAGETVEYRWFLSAKPASATGRVDHYTASCDPVVYDDGVPV